MNTNTNIAIFLLFALAFGFNNAFAIELGVATHFAQGYGYQEIAFKWMKSAGVKSYRDEAYWDDVEHQIGKYVSERGASESMQVLSEAKNEGINPLLILDYGNPLYDGGSQPYTEKGRAAFANYAGWVAKQLKGKVDRFEVWNEWNSGFGTNPEVNYGDPVKYVQLARTSYDAIKKVNPAAKVIVGAIDDLGIYGLGWQWLDAAINAGLLKKADGVSVHLYNQGLPANELGASDFIKRLQRLQTKLRASNGGKPVPFYVTEVGFSTYTGSNGNTEQYQAEQIARFLLEAHTIEDLAGIWWYSLVDDGDNPNNKEHRFGLLRISGKEKPAGCRLRSLAPFVKQSSLLQKVSNGAAQALLFRGKDGRTLLAVWDGDGYTDAVSNIEITGSFGRVKAFDQICYDRVIDGFKGASVNAIQIQAGMYPTLVWVEGDAKLTGIVRK